MTHLKSHPFCRHRRLLIPAVAVAAAAPAARAAVPGYTFSDLGVSPSATFSFAESVNSSGQIVYGVSGANGHSQAFVRNGGTSTALPTLGGRFNDPYDINASGQVTGSSGLAGTDPTADNPYHAYLFSGGAISDLGTLGGPNSVAPLDSTGAGINASGMVAGYSNLPDATDPKLSDGLNHAFVYKGGTMTALPGLGGPQSGANKINDAGVAAGFADTSDTTSTNEVNHAVTWTNGVIKDLGTIGGSGSGALAINKAGQAAGYSYTTGDAGADAVVWDGNTATDLGNLGGLYAQAWALNNKGVVVGAGYTPAQAASGFLATSAALFVGGQAYDLNTLTTAPSGWTLANAYGVNDAGLIVGDAYDTAGVEHAFLLTPVPEPTTVGIAGLASVGLAARRRRA